jgi:hypothetical protein
MANEKSHWDCRNLKAHEARHHSSTPQSEPSQAKYLESTNMNGVIGVKRRKGEVSSTSSCAKACEVVYMQKVNCVRSRSFVNVFHGGCYCSRLFIRKEQSVLSILRLRYSCPSWLRRCLQRRKAQSHPLHQSTCFVLPHATP